MGTTLAQGRLGAAAVTFFALAATAPIVVLITVVPAAYATGGGAGRCEYRLARTADGSVDVCVRDEGVWRPVPADNGHRGHGLRVIREIVDDLRVEDDVVVAERLVLDEVRSRHQTAAGSAADIRRSSASR